MMKSHIQVKYYNVFRDRYSYLFNHFLLRNIQKWKSRTWFSLSKYRYLVSSRESGWEKVENVEFQLVNLPVVVLCWKGSVKQRTAEIVERLTVGWRWIWLKNWIYLFPNIFFYPISEREWGSRTGKRIYTHKNSPFDNQNLSLNPVGRTWTLLMSNILQTNSTQQNF